MSRPNPSNNTAPSEPTFLDRARKMITNVADIGALAVALPGFMVVVRRGTEMAKDPHFKEAVTSMVQQATAVIGANDHQVRDPECADCGAYGRGWVVKDEVWEEGAGDDAADFLCMICFQKRLGRQLEPADFKGVPLNLPVFCALELGRSEAQDRFADFDRCYRQGARRDLEDWTINGAQESDEAWPANAASD